MKLPCRSASRLKAVTRPASGQMTAFACVEVVLSTQSGRPGFLDQRPFYSVIGVSSGSKQRAVSIACSFCSRTEAVVMTKFIKERVDADPGRSGVVSD